MEKPSHPLHGQSIWENTVYMFILNLQHNERDSSLWRVSQWRVYIGEIKQPLHRRMYQLRRSNTSGAESTKYLHVKDKGHTFEDDVLSSHIDGWFKRGMKEAIYVQVENLDTVSISSTFLNTVECLRLNLTSIFHAALSSNPKIKSYSEVHQKSHT